MQEMLLFTVCSITWNVPGEICWLLAFWYVIYDGNRDQLTASSVPLNLICSISLWPGIELCIARVCVQAFFPWFVFAYSFSVFSLLPHFFFLSLFLFLPCSSLAQKYRIIEYPDLEGILKIHRVQFLAPHRLPKIKPCVWRQYPMVLELYQLSVTTTALG